MLGGDDEKEVVIEVYSKSPEMTKSKTQASLQGKRKSVP